MIRFGLTKYTNRHYHGPLTEAEIREGDAREASRKARVIADLAAFDAQLRTLRREAKELHYTIDVSLVAPEEFKAQAGVRLIEVLRTTKQVEIARQDAAGRL